MRLRIASLLLFGRQQVASLSAGVRAQRVIRPGRMQRVCRHSLCLCAAARATSRGSHRTRCTWTPSLRSWCGACCRCQRGRETSTGSCRGGGTQRPASGSRSRRYETVRAQGRVRGEAGLGRTRQRSLDAPLNDAHVVSCATSCCYTLVLTKDDSEPRSGHSLGWHNPKRSLLHAQQVNLSVKFCESGREGSARRRGTCGPS